MKAGKKVFFNIPGFGRVQSMPGAEFDVGGVKREPVITDGGVVGFTEENVAPSVTFELPMMPGLSIEKLRNLTNVKVTIEYDSGQLWIMQSAFVTEPPKIKDGKIPMAMSGLRATEVR